MRRTARPDASARNSSSILAACVLALALAPALRSAASETRSLSQAIVTYGFLVRHYPDSFLLASKTATTPLERDMRGLGSALDSVGCDVPEALASAHRAIIVPYSSIGQWLGFPGQDVSPQEGLLFVLEPAGRLSGQALVVLSRMGPDETTILRIEEAKQRFSAELLYDSFRKGRVSNAPNTDIGTVTAVNLQKNRDVLLREWAEPGSRSGHMGETGRLFRLDPSRATVTLVSPRTMPRH